MLTPETLNPGNYEANVIADSFSTEGHRLTTLVTTIPRLVLAEYNTHRVFSRNSASTRAIPVSTQLRRVLDNPFIPSRFGIQQPGMQAERFAEGAQYDLAVQNWLLSRDFAVLGAVASLGGINSIDPQTGKPMLAEDLKDRIADLSSELGYGTLLSKRAVIRAPELNLNHPITDVEQEKLELLEEPLHKQLASRPLEAWMWQTIITTATEWGNFIALRDSAAAQPEIALPAANIHRALDKSNPAELPFGEWHTPIIGFEGDEKLSLADRLKVSVGRCARVSYLTHGGQRDTSADIRLHDQLYNNGHMSPFEHVARPQTTEELGRYSEFKGMVVPLHGNFRGWHQLRKDLPNEDNFGART